MMMKRKCLNITQRCEISSAMTVTAPTCTCRKSDKFQPNNTCHVFVYVPSLVCQCKYVNWIINDAVFAVLIAKIYVHLAKMTKPNFCK